jgi:hypothetical protein
VLTILAHATYKEQLFTLADYLTLRHHALSFEPDDWADLLRLADANGIRGAVTRCLRITMGIAQAIGDVFPWQPEVARMIGRPIVPVRMPHWLLNPMTLGLAVAERASASARARASLGQLLAAVANPTSRHSRGLYRQLWLRAKGHIY